MTEAERILWARCSVFTGSFHLEAAEAVCAGQGIAFGAAADLIDALVAKSILIRRPGGDRARYGRLDTIREYGLRRLRKTGGERRLRGRHRDWYAGLATRQEWLSAQQVQWIDRLDADHENVRAALEFCRAEFGNGQGKLTLHVLSLVPRGGGA